jgi:hypothetical protein
MSGRMSDEDLSIILSEKEQAIRKSGVLEYYHADDSLDGIGGMDVLKDWLLKRRVAFRFQRAKIRFAGAKRRVADWCARLRKKFDGESGRRLLAFAVVAFGCGEIV